jgi:hypothetical protein
VHSMGKLPQVHFLVFEGHHPHLWISHCEKYFEMYQVDPCAWVKVALMHLSPIVECWFQSVVFHHPHLSWPLLCKLLYECFSKDQYQFLLHQLFCIHQSGNVSEYIKQILSLVDQLSIYDSVGDHGILQLKGKCALGPFLFSFLD